METWANNQSVVEHCKNYACKSRAACKNYLATAIKVFKEGFVTGISMENQNFKTVGASFAATCYCHQTDVGDG